MSVWLNGKIENSITEDEECFDDFLGTACYGKPKSNLVNKMEKPKNVEIIKKLEENKEKVLKNIDLPKKYIPKMPKIYNHKIVNENDSNDTESTFIYILTLIGVSILIFVIVFFINRMNKGKMSIF